MTTLVTNGCRLVSLGFCLLLLWLAPPSAVAAPEPGIDETADGSQMDRPRIALVLSGGGARGGAHLGVIRVLEDLRVPVDMVVGTSGGAIVGGLYSGGWSPEEIEQWLGEMNWNVALADRLPRRQLPYRDKSDDDRFLFDLQIGIGEGGLRLPRSLIEGRNLGFILEQATLRTASIRDFDDLPIPFRAMATDLETADTVVLKEGLLSRAIRASMSVPGIFEPVRVDGRLLVDGGLVSNLPVGVAQRMGADIIIAVNAGSRLQSGESLVDIFDVSRQVMSLVVESNLQQSLDALNEDDILIEPVLKDIGSQDFPLTLDAARAGREAAGEMRDSLARLSVSEGEYERWLDSQRVRESDLGVLRDVRFSGLEQLDEERLRTSMDARVGESLSIELLQADIARLQRIGEIESLDYRINRTEEGSELVLHVNERVDETHHLRLGLEIRDSFDGGGTYNLRLGHTRPGLNAFGAEWRNELQIGRTRAVRTELYQPVTPGEGVFVSLPASHESRPLTLFQDGIRTGEVSFRRSRAGLDLGLRLGSYGEVRVGPWRGRLDSEPRIGGEGVSSLTRNVGGWRLMLNIDRLDDHEWPSSGRLIEAEAEWHRPELGADRSLRTSDVAFAQYWSTGSDRFLLAGQYAQADASLAYQEQFPIGGPFSVPGYRPGERRGDRVATLRAFWFRQLASAGLGRQAGALYVGAGIGGGQARPYGSGDAGSDPVFGGNVFMGLDTPIGPVLAGYARSDDGEGGFFLSLGIPIHRTGSGTSPW